jgi:hypothetical protein
VVSFTLRPFYYGGKTLRQGSERRFGGPISPLACGGGETKNGLKKQLRRGRESVQSSGVRRSDDMKTELA